LLPISELFCEFVVFGTFQSLKRSPLEIRHLILDKHFYPNLTKIQDLVITTHEHDKTQQTNTSNHDNSNVLRICQISDPHLGPFMSIKKLQSICERIVELDPDLVCLTGDFFTLQGLLIYFNINYNFNVITT
jgi:hypothetical protein